MWKGMNTDGKEPWKGQFERSELKLKDIKERDVGKHSTRVYGDVNWFHLALSALTLRVWKGVLHMLHY